MAMRKLITLVFCLIISNLIYAQTGKFAFTQLDKTQKQRISSFYLPNKTIFRKAIQSHHWEIYHENKAWIYFHTTTLGLHQAYLDGEIPDYYMQFSSPKLLNDSMRIHHKVNLVHNGVGLANNYQGEDVIIGLVDTGIEFDHPDFKDENGKTRILRIWDQSVNTGSTLSPYGYGIVWDSTQINAGLCTSGDAEGHGSTVAGAAAGNGRSTNYNQGVAPKADIIMITTDFSLPNWHMTVADACDYIFKVADSLGKPAVVNLSVGDYLGSHDGNDPASMFMEDLLNAQNGRIIVAACGNSGNMGNYHCQGYPTVDTTFVWFKNNPSSAFGSNKIFFDLFSDTSDAIFNYSLKAIDPADNYKTKGELIYRPSDISLGTSIYDTIWGVSGDLIAALEIYPTIEGGSFHLQVLFSQVDSINYHYGFYTVGGGKYDLWSGAGIGLNDMVETLPSIAILPSIVNYQLPDAEQTIISNWICSPEVVAVGNTRNRSKFLNKDGNYYIPSLVTPVGQLSQNSSKGPTRHQLIKPDITASGDVTLAPAPIWLLTDPAYNSIIDPGGWHAGNGGTSMASPVVAGIAALYLERCNEGNNDQFLELIRHFSDSNQYSGSLPNNAYGYGIINAYRIIANQEFSINMTGDSVMCIAPTIFEVSSTDTMATITWSNGNTTPINEQYTADSVYVVVHNENGCAMYSDTVNLIQPTLESINPINVEDNGHLLYTSSSNGTYQWTKDGEDIPGATNDTLILDLIQSGTYNCYTTGADGCTVYAGGIDLYLGIEQAKNQGIKIHPNPAINKVNITSDSPILELKIITTSGRIVTKFKAQNQLDISNLAAGMYWIELTTSKGKYREKLIKLNP